MVLWGSRYPDVKFRRNVSTYAVRFRSNRPEVLLRKCVLEICSKSTVEHPCRSAISIKLLCNFIEIALLHGFSYVNLLHFFRTPFPTNTTGWLLLKIIGNRSFINFEKTIKKAGRFKEFCFSSVFFIKNLSYCCSFYIFRVSTFKPLWYLVN